MIIKFDEKEKQYMNNQPIKIWSELKEDAGIIIEHGEIVGFEKSKG